MHVMSLIRKNTLAKGLAALVLAASAGCATTDPQLAAGASLPPQQVHQTVRADQAYIAHVEQVARRRGVTVQWVNLPTKRVEREQ